MFDFPSTPTLNQEYAAGPVTYKWNGVAWDIKQSGAASIVPAALTKVDDANVTMTLDGTPATALLQATNMTLGWTGTLSVARGGTGAATAAAALTALGAVAKAGDTMTGNLQIANAGPILSLNKTPASGGGNYIFGYGGSLTRWRMDLGDSAAESATAVGSNFAIHRYNNAGTFLGTAFSIDRETGYATFSGGGARFHDPAAPATSSWLYFTTAGTGWDRWMGFNGDDCMLGATVKTGKLWWNDYEVLNTNNGVKKTGPNTVTGAFTVAGDLTAYRSATEGVLYLSSSGSRYLQYLSPGGFYLTGGGLSVGGALNSTDITINGGTAYINSSGGISCSAIVSSTTSTVRPGGGDWLAPSDERIKTVEGEYARGLAEVVALRPVHYVYRGNDTLTEDGPSPNASVAETGQKFVGLIAQEVETVIPEMVGKYAGFIDGVAADDIRSLSTTPLLFALINAVKELKAEIEQLKAARA